ncbi:ATP-binding protein [Algibacter sp. PT7-4]|uniref:tetratricopeptide repeat-containing sensor histidine kinase n=1 Tax=Algibacter ulvanivorans TaxID=3400999 RepID=UPI003AAC57AF
MLNNIALTKNEFQKNWLSFIYYIKTNNNDSVNAYLNKFNNAKLLENKKLSRFNYLKGFYYKRIDNDSLRFYFYHNAYKLSEKENDTLTLLKSLEQLSQTYNYKTDTPYNKEYLDLLYKNAIKYNSQSYIIRYHFLNGNYYLLRSHGKKALTSYKTALKFNFNKNDSILLPLLYNNIGSTYTEEINLPDSAIYYFKKQSKFLKTNNEKFSNFLNIGSAWRKANNNNLAINYYMMADSLPLDFNVISNNIYIKENLAHLNNDIGNHKQAYKYLLDYVKLSDSLKADEHKISIANIKEQYDNEKLRADNLESESKRKQNRNLLFGALLIIFFGSITAFLIQKNTRKKQKLAEQEKALQTQKLATVLKEQELTSIDAMIEGQEKERQRIANDLHDDLGGLMATVKLHFNVLKDKQTPELFDKTNILLDEAYQKIRSIAHTKNSGVIAKQGLLKAVQNMADKISVSNKIIVDVIDHGLENRLENSLELTIFRIIQELITNVIKHAQATESTIHLTNHDDTLNIMIEDNGKGFNPNQVTTKNKGMGISSIDKRVEHLNGKMTIESEPNKGTTIIIDIPI